MKGRPAGVGQHADDQVTGKAYDARLVRRLWPFVRPHSAGLLFSLLTLAGIAAFELWQPLLLREAIDRHIARGEWEGLGRIALLFLATVAGAGLLRVLQARSMMMAGQRTVFDLRMALFSHLERLPSSFFDRNPVGRLITRATSDIEGIEELFSSGVVAIAGDVLRLAAIMVLMALLDLRLALVCFAVLPVLVISAVFFRGRIRDTYRLIRQRLARINAYLQENLLGIKVVKLFVQEGRSAREFSTLNREHLKAEQRGVLYESAFSAYVELLTVLGDALVIGFGGIAILSGGMTIGTLVAFREYVRKFFAPIEDISSKYTVLQSAMASTERVVRLLDTPAGIADPGRPETPPAREGRVEIEDVHFHYLEGEPVLRGVSLRIEPGEKVALVGATGSGKTTAVRLLNRLYDVSAGSVRVDGLDVRRWPLTELRRRIAVVLQDPFLFSGTIRDNITLGDPRIPEEAVRAAAETVHAARFIATLPGGYDYRVRERGTNLSAGQRQLVAFARALVADPEILVLDEATSSVDAETEVWIRDALETLLEGRTAVIVAHRLATARRADRIVVFHHGRIREQGTHRELMRAGDVYRRLVLLQAGEPDPGIGAEKAG